MSRKGRKILAPSLITLGFVAYIGFVYVHAFQDMAFWEQLVLGALFLGLAGLMVRLLFERWKEIQGGEEDDLSNY